MHVQNRTTTNVTMDPVKLVKKYEREIKRLKQELMMHDALADRSGVTYDEYVMWPHDTRYDMLRWLPVGPRQENRVA